MKDEKSIYDFVGFNFAKDCLLFGKRERFYISIGVGTWLAILGIIATVTIVTVRIYSIIHQ